MSEHVQTPTNALRIFHERSRIEGRLEVSALPRLADLLFDGSGEITYVAEGSMTPKGRPALRLELHGELGLICQRCLERLAWSVNVHHTLVLMDDDRELDPDEEDDDTDVIGPADAADLTDLVDQELALSLPMIPHHADGGCPVPYRAEEPVVRESAFSVLAGPHDR